MEEINVITAKSAGFCFGVKRAVNKVYELTAKTKGKVYTYGPIIHNEEVVKDLESKGVFVLDDLDSLSSIDNDSTLVIRSHGISKKEYDQILASGMEFVDATCPFVKKIHNLVSDAAKENNLIVIIGDPNHPEVRGIRGWCSDAEVFIVNSADEANQIVNSDNKKVFVVAQTTYNCNKFKELVEIIDKKGYYINVIDTICNATNERQSEAYELAKSCDAMIVIGSKSSSNTKKLYEICNRECANTYYIQTVDDLEFNKIHKFHSVGITAGASTPHKLIEEVQKHVRNKF